MLLDLRRLKQKLEVDAEIERTVPPEKFGVPPSGGGLSDSTTSPPEGGTPITRPTSSAITTEIKRRKRGVAGILAAIILLSVAGIVYYFYSTRGGDRTAIDSIAVLPLVNTSGDPNTEYLSDGITESLINSLSRMPKLKVMARTTVFSYKNRAFDPIKIGRELGVRAVLTGRVVQRGDALSIQADLVDVASGAQLWGERYDRKLTDILAVQDEIARHISEKLRFSLTGEEQQRLAKRNTENTEAYQLYLKGRFHWNKFTEEGARKSIDYFNQALAKDPNYALAYVGLSDAYGLLGQVGLPPNEVTPKALEYAEKALALDETLPEAHNARGAYELFYVGIGWWRSGN
jgi:TolB-like protein